MKAILKQQIYIIEDGEMNDTERRSIGCVSLSCASFSMK